MGQESKFVQNLYDTARLDPRRVVFAEGTHPKMLEAAVNAKEEGICQPILLGNREVVRQMAADLKLNLDGVEVIDLRADDQQERRTALCRPPG